MADSQPPSYEELFPNAQTSSNTQTSSTQHPPASAPPHPTNPLTINFVTHSNRHELVDDPDVPYVWYVDCTRFVAPPRSLRERYTGLDPELADSFFSVQENYQAYRDLVYIFRRELDLWRSLGSAVAVVLCCSEGMHSSVVMAERLARRVSGWSGVEGVCKHMDMYTAIGNAERAGRGDYSGSKAWGLRALFDHVVSFHI